MKYVVVAERNYEGKKIFTKLFRADSDEDAAWNAIAADLYVDSIDEWKEPFDLEEIKVDCSDCVDKNTSIFDALDDLFEAKTPEEINKQEIVIGVYRVLDKNTLEVVWDADERSRGQRVDKQEIVRPADREYLAIVEEDESNGTRTVTPISFKASSDEEALTRLYFGQSTDLLPEVAIWDIPWSTWSYRAIQQMLKDDLSYDARGTTEAVVLFDGKDRQEPATIIWSRDDEEVGDKHNPWEYLRSLRD